MGGGQRRENSIRDRLGKLRVVPQDHAALRSTECFTSRPRQNNGSFVQWILELSTRDQPRLMGAIENKFSTPLGDDLAHLTDWQGEERHGHAHDHEFWFGMAGKFCKVVEIHFEFIHVEW